MFKAISDKIGISRVVFALSLARLGDAVGNSLLFVVVPLYVARMPAAWFPVSETIRVGILISIYGFFAAFGEPIVGSIVDRIGHRKLMIQIGLIIMTLSLLAYTLANHYSWLLVLRATQGIGLSITVPATLALMAAATRTETRGRAMGFFSAMRMLGLATGPLLGGWLVTSYGFFTTFCVGAGCVALAIFFVQIWVREEKQSRDRGNPAQSEGDAPGFFDRRIWSAGVVGSAVAMLAMSCAYTMMVTLEKQFNQMLHINAFIFSLAFSSLTFSRLLFQFPLGWLSDCWGRKPVILAGLLLLAPSTLLLGWVGAVWQLVILRIVQGVGSAAVAAPAFALAADSSRAGGQGRQMSITTVGFSLGMAVGPLMSGFLADYFFALPFIVGSAVCVVGAGIIYWFTPETVKKEHRCSAPRVGGEDNELPNFNR